MTEQVRYRIDKKLVKEAERVCKEIGLSPSQAVSIFFAQMVKLGGVPFRVSNFPALEEYGATLAEAEAAEFQARRELDALAAALLAPRCCLLVNSLRDQPRVRYGQNARCFAGCARSIMAELRRFHALNPGV